MEGFVDLVLVLYLLYVLRGTFKMERQDSSTFECRIPPFSLESKHEDGSTPHGFTV